MKDIQKLQMLVISVVCVVNSWFTKIKENNLILIYTFQPNDYLLTALMAANLQIKSINEEEHTINFIDPEKDFLQICIENLYRNFRYYDSYQFFERVLTYFPAIEKEQKTQMLADFKMYLVTPKKPKMQIKKVKSKDSNIYKMVFSDF